MSTNAPLNAPLNSQRIAEKIAHILDHQDEEIVAEVQEVPALIEVLLWLQFLSVPSNFEGGLKQFARELIEESEDLLGTETMRIHRDRPWSEDALLEIEREMHGDIFWDEAAFDALLGRTPAHSRKETTDLTRPQIIELCRGAAEENLLPHLREMCERKDVRFTRHCGRCYGDSRQAPWYFADLGAALLRKLANWKSECETQIAETAITREVSRWLRHARRTRRSVIIFGNSRFGKTEAIRAWARANAGVARIVDTPAGNSEAELLGAIARAIGIDPRPYKRIRELREDVLFVVTKAKLLLIFEEAQALFPVNCGRNTAPARLNFVRRGFMDADIPCVFICTPQSYQHARKGFLKATDFAIEQFDGRIIQRVALPETISREDMIAIARAHLPELPEAVAVYVAERASSTQRNYVSDVSTIAALARSLAEDAGRPLPVLADIDGAILDLLPPPEVPSIPSRSGTSAQRLQVPRAPVSGPLQREIAPPVSAG